MAITVTSLLTGGVKYSNAKSIKIIPYTDPDTMGAAAYVIGGLIGDTVSVTPDANTVNTKESETSSDPALQNITQGMVQFAANSVDFQESVLVNILGFTKDTPTGAIYRPAAYKEIFARIEVDFYSDTSVLVLPKVKLNSLPVINTLKTGSGEVQIAGTAYTGNILTEAAGATSIDTDWAVIPSDKIYYPA